MIEISLALPLLAILCLGIIDGGRAYSYSESVTNADHQVLRVVAQQKSVGNAACTGTGTTATAKQQAAHIPWQTGDTLPSWVAKSAQLENQDGSGNSRIATALVTVTFHCLSGNAITNATATTSDPSLTASDSVEVSVCYSFVFLTPLVARLYGTRNCPGTSVSNSVSITDDAWARAEY